MRVQRTRPSSTALVAVKVDMPAGMKAELERIAEEWGIGVAGRTTRRRPGQPGVVPEIIRALCRQEIQRRRESRPR